MNQGQSSSSQTPIPASSNSNLPGQPSQISTLPRVHFIDVLSATRSGSSLSTVNPTATITATLGTALKDDQTLRYSLDEGVTWVTVPGSAISNGTNILLTDITLSPTTNSLFLAVFAGNQEGDQHGQISRQLITVDTTSPAATLTKVLFNEIEGQLLLFGQDLMTVLGYGETSSSDIKNRLDWSKLLWATGPTTNIAFSLNDIASARITSDNNLVITLTDAKRKSLTEISGYGANNSINISMGFLKDAAGNVATGDNLSNGKITLLTTASSLTGAVDIKDDLKLVFADTIQRGNSGNIKLYRGDGSLVEAFDVAASTALTYQGNELIINPTWDLQGSTSYYITIDDSSITDANGNSWGSISDNSLLSFTTGVEIIDVVGDTSIRDQYPGTSRESIGDHRALYIPITFPDINRSPTLLSVAETDMNDTEQFFIENSQGVMTLSTDYTPLVTLPYTHEWLKAFDYTFNGLGNLQVMAQTEARKLGYDSSQYNVGIVRSDAGLRAGASWGGGNSVWVDWGGWSVMAHEAGHALGLPHSRSIDWGGNIVEYGSRFDVMGGESFGLNSDFILKHKRNLGWIETSAIWENPGSGLYRLHGLDQVNRVVGQKYGFNQTIPADILGNNPKFTLEYRPSIGGLGVTSAYLLRDDAVIDLTPGSSSHQLDGGIQLGQTYQIPGSQSYFTVFNQGDGFLDVAYKEGSFPDNVAPRVTLTASATTVKQSGKVTFSAEGIDDNGDMLVYRWTFSDGVVGTGDTFTRTFTQSSATTVTATLTVSDMRGGVATQSIDVTAGAASTGTPQTVGSLTPPTYDKPRVAVTANQSFTTEGGEPGEFTFKRIGTSLDNDLTINLTYSGTAIPVVPDAWSLLNSYPTTQGTLRPTVVRVADIDPKNLTLKLNGGSVAYKDQLATVVENTIVRSVGSLSFWVQGTQEMKAVKLELQDQEDGILVRAVTAKTNQTIAINTGTAANQGSVSGGNAGQTFTTKDLGTNNRLSSITVFGPQSSAQGTVLTLKVWENNGAFNTWAPGNLVATSINSQALANNQPVVFNFNGEVLDSNKVYLFSFSNGTPDHVGFRAGTATQANSIADGVLFAQGSIAPWTTSDLAFNLMLSPDPSTVGAIDWDNQGTELLVSTSATANGVGVSQLQILGSNLLTPGMKQDLFVPSRDVTNFTNLPTSIVIPAGQGEFTLKLDPVDDDVIEPVKNLVVSIAESDTYSISSQNPSATLTLHDNDTPVVTIETIDGVTVEGGESGLDTGVMLIRRTRPTDQPLTVYYGLTGTAHNGGDYARLDGQIVIPAGESSVALSIIGIDDEVGEPDETVTVHLTTFNDVYSVGAASSATVTIKDNGDTPVVSVRASGSRVNEGGSATLQFNVIGGNGEPLTVQYSVRGTATPGVDFKALTGEIILPTGGNRTVNLPIETIADGLNEHHESVVVSISPSDSYVVGLLNNAQIQIAEVIDTAIGEDRVSVSRFHYEPEWENGTNPASFYIYRDNTSASSEQLTVTFSLTGTATPGQDYTGRILNQDLSEISTFTPQETNTVIIPADAKGIVVSLEMVDDDIFEGTETITLTLEYVAGSKPWYPFGISRSATYLIRDNDPGTIQVGFESPLSSTSEAVGPDERILEIPVVLNQAATENIVVSYVADGGTALGMGADYTFLDSNNAEIMGGNLTFEPGQTRKVIKVRIQSDPIAEDKEFFNIKLDYPTGASLKAGFDSHRVLIYDVIPDGLILEERWSGQAVFNNNTWDSAPRSYTDFLGGLTPARDVGNDYSRRLTGYITAPITGDYTFYLAGDDDGRLYLSTTESAENKQQIASVSGATNFQQWDKSSNQKSQPITLQAGQRYYIEVHHREVGGGDHVSVGWTLPGYTTIVPITTATSPASQENPYVRFLTHSSTILEGNEPQILVTLDRPNPSAAISVELAVNTQNSTASSSDYNLASRTLTFAPGEITKAIPLSILADNINENAEKLSVQLVAANGAQIIKPDIHELLILDAQAPQIGNITGSIFTRTDIPIGVINTGTAAGQGSVSGGNAGQTFTTKDLGTNNQLSSITVFGPQSGAHSDVLTLKVWENNGAFDTWAPGNLFATSVNSQSLANNQPVVFNFSGELLDSNKVYLFSFSNGTEDHVGFRAGTATQASSIADGVLFAQGSIAGWTNNSDLAFNLAVEGVEGAVGSVVATIPVTLADGREVQSWQILTGNPVVQGQSTPAFAIDQQGRITLANPAALPLDAYELVLTVNVTDDQGSGSLGQARVVIDGGAAGSPVERLPLGVSAPSGISTFSMDTFAITDSGTSATINAGEITRDHTLGLSGTADAGSNVKIYSGDRLLGQTTATAGNTWAFTTPILGNGTHSFRAEVIDLQGNIAVTTPVMFEVSDQFLVDNVFLLSRHPDNGISTGTNGIANIRTISTIDQGVVVYEVLDGAPFQEQRWAGTNVFTNNTWDSATPTYSGTLPELTTPQNVGNDYSRRLTGYITAPRTGDYTFYLAGDDEGRLYLSTTDSPEDKQQIASLPGWTNFQQWNKHSSQKSAAITLEAGQRYYIEVHHREDGGGDHISVGWTDPGISQITPITIPTNLMVANGTTGEVQLVSRSATDATTAAGVPTTYGGISPNGQYVVFGTSQVEAFGNNGSSFNDTNTLINGTYTDILVFDRSTSTMQLVTAGDNPSTSESRQAEFIGISADNKYIIYTTDYVEHIADFSAPGKPQPSSWILVDGGYPTTAGTRKSTAVRVADIDPTKLTLRLNGGSLTNKNQLATVVENTIVRSEGSLSFWVQGTEEMKAVKLELQDQENGILVRAVTAKTNQTIPINTGTPNNRGTLSNNSGQTFTTKDLGTNNRLSSIRVFGPLDNPLDTLLTLKVWENNGEFNTWAPGNLVATSVNSLALSPVDQPVVFNFNGEVLDSNKVYLFSFSNGTTNHVSFRPGITNAEGSVIADGALFSNSTQAFSGPYDLAFNLILSPDPTTVGAIDWDNQGTELLVSTSATANGVGVSVLESIGENITNQMKVDLAVASRDVVAFNLTTGEQMLLSHSSAPDNKQSQAADVRDVTLSADGRYVLFSAADASKLGNNGTAFTDAAPTVRDWFATNLETGEVRLLSSSNANASAGVPITLMGTSSNGSYAVFSASNLTPFGFTDHDDTVTDIFSINLDTGTSKLISRQGDQITTSAGHTATFQLIQGNHVYFHANDATAFGFSGDGNTDGADLFRYDLVNDTLELLSHTTTDVTHAFHGSYVADSLTVSPNGRYVAFDANLAGNGSGFTLQINGNALLIVDTQTDAIRLVNASNNQGSNLSYTAWAGNKNPRFFTPDSQKLIWQTNYLGFQAMDNRSYGPGAELQWTPAALMLDLSNGVMPAGTAQISQILSHGPDSLGQIANGNNNRLLGVSADSRLAFFRSNDAGKFGNDGVAFQDSAPNAADVFAIDLNTRRIDLVSGQDLQSYGQPVTFLGSSAGGSVLLSLKDVRTIRTPAGNLTDVNGLNGTDLLAVRTNLIALSSQDHTDNNLFSNNFRLNSRVVPGMDVELLDNGQVVDRQTADASGVITWDLDNVTPGQHTYTLRYPGDVIPINTLESLGSSSLTLNVYESIVNEAPTAVILNNTVPTLAENTDTTSRVKVADIAVTDDALGDETITLSGDDAALFEVLGTELFLKAGATLDFETNPQLDVTVEVDDDTVGVTPDVTTNLAIAVTDVNEAPTITSGTTASFAENNTGTVYATTATDPDANSSLTYSLGGTDAGLFNIDSSTGVVTFKTAPDFETPSDNDEDNTYNITVTASDGSLSSTAQTVAIAVTNVNEAPTITSDATASFAENVTGPVYATAATDPDANSSLTYSLGGTDAGLFNIDSSTGVVTFKTAPDFELPQDQDNNNVYDITVIANDGTVNSAPQAVSVMVIDQVIFTINDVTVNEADGTANFTVTTTDPVSSLGGSATVNYATTHNTAFAEPYDYVATSGTLTFTSGGATTQTISVDINDDSYYEPTNETFFVNLSSPSSNAAIADAKGVGTIVDNDTQSSLSISGSQVVEGDSGTQTLYFLVEMSEASGQTVTVDYTINDGSATAGLDFVSGTGTLSFNPGNKNNYVAVQVIGDELNEGDETFTVTLSNPVGAEIATGKETATGTILDDDGGATTVTYTGTASTDYLIGDPAPDSAIVEEFIGNGGNDYLIGYYGDNTFNGGAGSDYLLGYSGKDTFVYDSFADSTASAPDFIPIFSSNDGDRLQLPSLPGKFSNVGTVIGTSLTQAATNAYSAANLAVNEAVYFQYGRLYYLAVNDSNNAGFSNTDDLLVRMGALGLSNGEQTVANFFTVA